MIKINSFLIALSSLFVSVLDKCSPNPLPQADKEDVEEMEFEDQEAYQKGIDPSYGTLIQ